VEEGIGSGSGNRTEPGQTTETASTGFSGSNAWSGKPWWQAVVASRGGKPWWQEEEDIGTRGGRRRGRGFAVGNKKSLKRMLAVIATVVVVVVVVAGERAMAQSFASGWHERVYTTVAHSKARRCEPR